jgi:hypothetical protein
MCKQEKPRRRVAQYLDMAASCVHAFSQPSLIDKGVDIWRPLLPRLTYRVDGWTGL